MTASGLEADFVELKIDVRYAPRTGPSRHIGLAAEFEFLVDFDLYFQIDSMEYVHHCQMRL